MINKNEEQEEKGWINKNNQGVHAFFEQKFGCGDVFDFTSCHFVQDFLSCAKSNQKCAKKNSKHDSNINQDRPQNPIYIALRTRIKDTKQIDSEQNHWENHRQNLIVKHFRF